MEKEYYYVWLSLIPKLGYVKIKEIMEKNNVESVDKLYDLDVKHPNMYEKLVMDITYKIEAEKMYKEITKNKIEIIHIESENYPSELKDIYSPPVALYAKGNVDLLKGKKVGMVGSRLASNYGKKVAYNISKKFVGKDMVVVSGLAKGIDEYSHIGACEGLQAKTIAVIGTGLDDCYPAGNKYLERRILSKNGLILSEFVLGIGPKRHHFPMRNRIIAGLSDFLVVVEAKEKSGALITVDMMLESGKEVYAVPGPIGDDRFAGSNRLIKDGSNVILDI
ncbi:MAG: DNA-processing protein DprA [Clostridia bacterium]